MVYYLRMIADHRCGRVVAICDDISHRAAMLFELGGRRCGCGPQGISPSPLPVATAAVFNRMDRHMYNEKIEVRVTSSGQKLQVVVLNKGLDMIQIVLGEGVHNVRCNLTPTRNGAAYMGNAMGRELIYERSREEVKADLVRAAGFRDFKR